MGLLTKLHLKDSPPTPPKKTLPEILTEIHRQFVAGQLYPDSQWDCVLSDNTFHNAQTKEQNEWCDAAYKGDWDALFQIAWRAPEAMGRLVNATRLRSLKELQKKRPSGYSALHQAAYHGAPPEIVQALVELGAFRWAHSTEGKYQRPIDIARERNLTALYQILEPPHGLPELSDADLLKVEKHFHGIIATATAGCFNETTMRPPDLSVLREVDSRFFMTVPGMYGGISFGWENGHLISESSSRVVGGSGMTYHITPSGTELVASGWG